MSRSVLVDCRMMMEKPDGIGRYLSLLVPELVDLAPDLHFHLLRRPHPWPGYGLTGLERPNVTHHASKVRQMSLQQHLILPMLAKRLSVDLMHYPHYDAPVTLTTVPVVATIHDLKYLRHPEWYLGTSGLKNLYARWSYRQTAQRAAAIIAVSHHTAKEFRDAFSEVRGSISVVYEAADPKLHQSVPADIARRRFGINRPFILTVGERRPHKNHVGLIRAYSASRAMETHQLVLIGNPYRNYRDPERTAATLGLGDKVRFLAGVDDRDLAGMYAEAQLFVMVSKHEGFGLPLLEAMTAGTPVIASNTTATGEIAGSGALQVAPDDLHAISSAIDRLLEDAETRSSQIARGREWVGRFSWRRAAAETLSVYRGLMTA